MPIHYINEESDEVVYCRECGSEDTKYLCEYANGVEYKCKNCGNVFMA